MKKVYGPTWHDLRVHGHPKTLRLDDVREGHRVQLRDGRRGTIIAIHGFDSETSPEYIEQVTIKLDGGETIKKNLVCCDVMEPCGCPYGDRGA